MPSAFINPGVHVEELPSGVRTITGVATSITAFLGRAARGPVNAPGIINSYGDYELTFGGLDLNCPLSYAVRDFYLNGGSQAIIVRLFSAPDGMGEANGKALMRLDDLELIATSEGKWGENLRASADVDVSEEIRTKLGVAADVVIFNLTVTEKIPGGRSETFLNLTVADSPRRIDRVLADQSSLVEWNGTWPRAGGIPKLQKFRAAISKLTDLRTAQAANPPVPAAIHAAKIAFDAAKARLVDSVTAAEAALKAALDANPQIPRAITRARAELTTKLGAMKAGDSKSLVSQSYKGSPENKTGLFALDKADLFNLLCIPPDVRGGDTAPDVYQAAMSYCEKRRAMLLVDPPAGWGEKHETAVAKAIAGLGTLGLSGPAARNAALFFPRVVESDPRREDQLDVFVPCGIVAGVMARTDAQRGVWKAPAGLDASLGGIAELQVNLNDAETGRLNPLGINCLRAFPNNRRVVWGSRTLRGADQLADEYKYIPVRRLALYLEESLFRGTKWVVFEPNDEPLWAQIRLNVGAFLHGLFRNGAFQGQTPRDAYFVKCDQETTTQADINQGTVNIIVGFAPLKPAEFVVIKLQQMAGQIEAHGRLSENPR